MTTFKDLGLPIPLCHELAAQGISTPFPIQEAAIPDALAGKDVLGRGPTGSGKTFTFGLPILARLSESGASKPGAPRALVLVPTRELAIQVRERLETPAARLGLRVLDVVGGVNINRHISALARPVDLLVATPGRAQDLVDRKVLSLGSVSIAALDEADQMADMGFVPQVRKLLRLTPKDGQRLLFSATLDGEVDKLVKEFMHSPVTHSTAPAEVAVDSMEHYVFHVKDRPERNDVVTRIAAREGRTIMFMRAKHAVDRQVKKLRRAGIDAQPLHGDKGQGARTRAITAFRDGSSPVLVATDIAARGIDVEDVSLVVHVDPPAEHKAYVHRAGRTARAGTAGTVVTMATEDQRDDVAKLLKKAGVSASHKEVTVDSPELAQITGAREPSGTPLPPPGMTQASPNPRRGKARGEAGSPAGGRRGAGQKRAAGRSSRRAEDKGRGNNKGGGAPRPAKVRADGSAAEGSQPTRRRRRRRH